MRNSRISSIANASRNLHWDKARLNLTASASAVDSAFTSGQAPFHRSKALGRGANPNTNEGIVHLIHKIIIATRVSSGTATAEAAAYLRFQLLRRQLQNIALIDLQDSPSDVVAFDFSMQKEADLTSTGALATLVANPGFQPPQIPLDPPIVMVMPYFLVAGGTAAANSSAIAALVDVYMQVESIRVKGEEYRRLLDAYTQVPSLLEKRE